MKVTREIIDEVFKEGIYTKINTLNGISEKITHIPANRVAIINDGEGHILIGEWLFDDFLYENKLDDYLETWSIKKEDLKEKEN